MTAPSKVLQILPHVPGTFDGVGDYALRLARVLRDEHGMQTTFLVAAPTSVEAKDGFAIVSGFLKPSFEPGLLSFDHVILHYSNYGYARRGVPFGLRDFARNFRRSMRGKWMTVFHELSAVGPPWRSAFWTRPFQVRIARDLIHLSDACVVSNGTVQAQVRRLASDASVLLQAVPSNFGDPVLDRAEIAARDPHRWVICGGTALLEKSVRSFSRVLPHLPEQFSPRELSVFGGIESATVRQMLKQLPGVTWTYQPEVDATAASEILSQSSFAWLDYFHHPSAPTDALFKSTIFAALCAHGVIAVFPHQAKPLVFQQEILPGPFFVEPGQAKLPLQGESGEIGWKLYNWYHRHASLKRLARVIAGTLGSNNVSSSGL